MLPLVPNVPLRRGGVCAAGSVWSLVPGLVARYRFATTSNWPDTIGTIGAGVHTGSPSTATASGATGMSYNGASQYTTIGSASSMAFIHQTWTFGVSVWFRWDGPSAGTALEAILGSTITTNDKGFYVAVEDRSGSGGPLALRAALHRGQTSVATVLLSSSSALTVGQLHHVLLTGNGSTVRLYLDGSQVASDTPIATATGNASNATRIGDGVTSFPSFAFAGDVFDVAISTADISAFASAIYAEGPG